MTTTRNYRLAFVDLDGTLLAPDKSVSPANQAALDRLAAESIQVVAATGRHHGNMLLIPALAEQGWLLSANGAVVRHRETDELLHELCLPAAQVREILAAGRALGVTQIVYHREGAFMDREDRWTQFYRDLAHWEPGIVNFDELDTATFLKIVWAADAPFWDKRESAIREEFAGRAHVVKTLPELLEFMSPQVNKAAGAEALARRLGVDATQVLAFGDSHNDVEMLQWAGFSVAMHHGEPAAHEAAKAVSPPGDPGSAFARAVELALSAD